MTEPSLKPWYIFNPNDPAIPNTRKIAACIVAAIVGWVWFTVVIYMFPVIIVSVVVYKLLTGDKFIEIVPNASVEGRGKKDSE
jgi:hypothetical protein